MSRAEPYELRARRRTRVVCARTDGFRSGRALVVGPSRRRCARSSPRRAAGPWTHAGRGPGRSVRAGGPREPGGLACGRPRSSSAVVLDELEQARPAWVGCGSGVGRVMMSLFYLPTYLPTLALCLPPPAVGRVGRVVRRVLACARATIVRWLRSAPPGSAPDRFPNPGRSHFRSHSPRLTAPGASTACGPQRLPRPGVAIRAETHRHTQIRSMFGLWDREVAGSNPARPMRVRGLAGARAGRSCRRRTSTAPGRAPA